MQQTKPPTSDESARTSLKRGASPSRLAVLEIGSDSGLAAQERAAAMEKNPDHGVTKVVTHWARGAGV